MSLRHSGGGRSACGSRRVVRLRRRRRRRLTIGRSRCLRRPLWRRRRRRLTIGRSRCLRRRWRGNGRRRGRRCRSGVVVSHVERGEERTDRDRLPLLDPDFLERPGDRRRDLGVHLVRLHLDEEVVLVHLLAGLLQPLADRAFGDRLTELGHLQLKNRQPNTSRAMPGSPRPTRRQQGSPNTPPARASSSRSSQDPA